MWPSILRVRRHLERRSGCGRDYHPAGARRQAGKRSGIAVRPGRDHLPHRGNLSHAGRMEPLGGRITQPGEERHLTPDRDRRDRLVAVHVHHELALHAARPMGPFRRAGTDLLPLSPPADGDRSFHAEIRAPGSRSGDDGAISGLEPGARRISSAHGDQPAQRTGGPLAKALLSRRRRQRREPRQGSSRQAAVAAVRPERRARCPRRAGR